MIHLNAVCDRKGCGNTQPAAFDSRDETWGGLLDALRAAGWVLMKDVGFEIGAICPACAAKEANGHFPG